MYLGYFLGDFFVKHSSTCVTHLDRSWDYVNICLGYFLGDFSRETSDYLPRDAFRYELRRFRDVKLRHFHISDVALPDQVSIQSSPPFRPQNFSNRYFSLNFGQI
jgi:hypothetical protein